jgi:hypothetical protein
LVGSEDGEHAGGNQLSAISYQLSEVLSNRHGIRPAPLIADS